MISVKEFCECESTGSKFLLKISYRKTFFDLTFTDFQIVRQFRKQSVSKKMSITKKCFPQLIGQIQMIFDIEIGFESQM